MSETKSMKVSVETHQALTAIGRKGESFDAILRRLIVFWVKVEQHGDPGIPKSLYDIEKEAEG